MRRRLFVTTALPYANGPFHIGHIMEYIQADVWVRFQRMQGHEVHFIGADDAHGAPIMLAAEKAGKSPEQFIAEIAKGRKQYLDGFHIAFDNWHSTHSKENTELSQDIYRKLDKAGLVYKEPIAQLFDPVKGMFLADRYIKGECPNCGAKDQYGDACENCGTVYSPTKLKNPYSTLSGAKPVLKSSEHHFFKLSDTKCKEFLREWINKPGRLQRVPCRRRHRDDPLHRQGHHLLPHPVLAGDAEVLRLQDPGSRLRPRLHYRVGRQDVEIARNGDRSTALSQARNESGVATLLHCREAQCERGGHRFRSGRFPGADQQRPCR